MAITRRCGSTRLNPKRILSGSDGGWQISYDGGKTWDVVNTFPFTQFYHVNYDMQRPYMSCGGLQDNGNWCGPSHDASRAGIASAWTGARSRAATASSPCRMLDKPWLIYSDAQGGMLNITDTRTGTSEDDLSRTRIASARWATR